MSLVQEEQLAATSSEALAEALAQCTGAFVARVSADGQLTWSNARHAAWFGLLQSGAGADTVFCDLLKEQPLLREAIAGRHRRSFGGIWRDTSLFINVLPTDEGSLFVCQTSVFEGGVSGAAEIPLESDSVIARLTSNEREVLELIGSGMKTKEIAKIIHRSEKTIEARRSALGKKLGLETRGELVRVAVRAGLSRL